MAFDPMAVLQAASSGAEVVTNFVNTVSNAKNNKVEREEKKLDGMVERREKQLNGASNRAVQEKLAKVTNIQTSVTTVASTLETVSQIYINISNATNLSRKTKEEIEKNRQQFELDKQRIYKEFDNANKQHNENLEKIQKDHDEKMRHMEMWHQQEMEKILNERERIFTVKEAINTLLNLITNVASEDPTNPDIHIYVSQLNNCLVTLNSCSNVQYIEEKI